MKRDLVIIGGGPAGLAAAIEARKKGVKDIVIIEREKQLGGILQQCIHDGFGLHEFGKQLTGPEYAQKFIDEVEDLNIEYMIDTTVINISKTKVVTAINTTKGVFTIECRAVILAMGCRERNRGAIGIPGTRPAGIFTAGSAQRFINVEGYMVGKRAVILGSGDIGLIMARRMVLEGTKVEMVIEIMPYSTGLKRNVVQCLEDYNIPLLFNHTVIEIHGRQRLEGVTIAKVDDEKNIIKGTEKFVECDTLLLSVGLIPENELSREVGLNLQNITGGPYVNEIMGTSIDGIFACGNVVHVHDLVDFVSEEGRLCGKGATKYLNDNIKENGEELEVVAKTGIRYVVPNAINVKNVDDFVTFYMRVDKPYYKINLIIKDGENYLRNIKKQHVTPGEMEMIKIDSKTLREMKSNVLSFEIQEVI